MNNQIEELLAQMTLEEKVAMAAGSDMWHSTGVERLGIPPFKVSDGPNGARGGGLPGVGVGLTSACFPVGISLASTWNVELVKRVGAALGQETQSKSAQVLLGPTVNIHRSPLNGRNFECYSEDPYLTAQLGVAYIQGVQSEGVGACVKHFVCNDSEFQRMSISSEVGERALREIYLPPFKAAVQEGEVWSVMSAYNKLNGDYCSANPYTLTEILRDEWGFEGFVVSDWFGTNSTVEVANAGLDLEMPGPARFLGDRLLAAVKAGDVAESVIDDKVRHLLDVVLKSGLMENPETPEQAIDLPEHRAVIREAAAEGIVLLKNEGGLLPLDAGKLNSIAVIGPNAPVARAMGGGSAQVNAHYFVSPLEGIDTRCGDNVEINFARGCSNNKSVPVIDSGWLATADGEPGALTVEFYDSLDLSGAVVRTERMERLQALWFGEVGPGVNPGAFSARLSGTITPPASGDYTFALTSAGVSRLFVDGELVLDNWENMRPGGSFFGMGSYEVTTDLTLTGGVSHEIVVEYSRERATALAALVVGALEKEVGDPIVEAEQLAATADVALVFVGTSEEWESEGFDRPDMDLPGRQAELIERVAAANPNTVVVLNNGSPLTMDWIDQVPALLEAWFPGQECGNAIADVLFGDVCPSGKLPQTFPKRLEDNPAYINYPGDNGKVVYGEGIFVGYRYYDKKAIEPRFPFGYGLSYTTFAYDNLRLEKDVYELGEPITACIDITNSRRSGRQGDRPALCVRH